MYHLILTSLLENFDDILIEIKAQNKIFYSLIAKFFSILQGLFRNGDHENCLTQVGRYGLVALVHIGKHFRMRAFDYPFQNGAFKSRQNINYGLCRFYRVKKAIWIDFALPILIAILITAILSLTNADMAIEKRLYSPDAGWFIGQDNPWYFLYHYGNIPAFLLAIAGLLAFVFSFLSGKFFPYRKIGLFFVIFMILGPGLVINTVLKDHWGRPRPADIVDFGGKEAYCNIWDEGQSGQGKSFPSGHASVGFFLFSPFFILRKTSRKWASIFLCLGIIYGALMGFGRMVQGGHFLTDVLWSGAFTYLTGLSLYYIFGFDREPSQSSAMATTIS
jgi:lipid A 4'-phosphatase